MRYGQRSKKSVIGALSGIILSLTLTAVIAVQGADGSTPGGSTQAVIPRTSLGPLSDANAADLIVASSSWLDHKPMPGNIVGVEGVFQILVKNAGEATADASVIRYECVSLSGAPPPQKMSGTLNCPKLTKNATSLLAWPPIDSEKWKEGKYRLRIELDAGKSIVEKSETNNMQEVVFSVMHKTQPSDSPPPPPGPKRAEKLILKKPDLVIQNIAMTPSSPKEGDEICFTITIRNVGDAISSAGSMTGIFERTRIENGELVRCSHDTAHGIPHALNPGEIETFNFNVDIFANHSKPGVPDYNKARSGDTIRAKFIVFTTSATPESDDSNNSKTLTFMIQ